MYLSVQKDVEDHVQKTHRFQEVYYNLCTEILIKRGHFKITSVGLERWLNGWLRAQADLAEVPDQFPACTW